jgi:apolipoprotein N-acyltransferase
VRMRAAENRRWILRSTNDGVTGTIDPAGRIRGTLPLYTQATSYTGFNYISEQTFYTRHGDWFPVVCAVLALTALAASARLRFLPLRSKVSAGDGGFGERYAKPKQ